MRLVMLLTKDVYGRKVKAGEEFEVPDNEGVTWVKLGYAKRILTMPKPAKPSVEDRQLTGGARYRRSDMRAEED